MVRILFVCLGNIGRSPMAEFIMKDMIHKSGMDSHFIIDSAGTSSEELGNPVHPGTRNKLKKYGISCDGKTATQLQKSDYNKYDLIIAMEQSNVREIMRIFGRDPQKKVMRLLDKAERPRDIADPWYTGDFDKTYDDIHEGCEELMMYVVNEEMLY